MIYDINGPNFRDIKVTGTKLFNQTKYIGFPVNLPNSTPDFPDFREAHHHGKPKANKNSWLTWLEVWAPSKHRKKPWKSHGKPSFWEHDLPIYGMNGGFFSPMFSNVFWIFLLLGPFLVPHTQSVTEESFFQLTQGSISCQLIPEIDLWP